MTQTLSLEEMRANAIAGPPIDFAVSPNPLKPLTESERHLRREHLKQQIAEGRAKGQRAATLAKKVAEIDREADAAADIHHQQVAPLRARLTEIDAETQRLFALHQPIPDALLDEQGELMGQIEAAGVALKLKCDEVKERRRPVAAEVQRLRLESATQHLENKLTQPPLVNPELHDREWGLKKLATLFGSSVHAISKYQRTLGHNDVSKPKRYDLAAERGQKVLAELDSELAELREQMIAE